jgi:hypothetical protein
MPVKSISKTTFLFLSVSSALDVRDLLSRRNSKTVSCQLEVKGRLGDRVRDIREWREELSRELTKLLEEVEHLEEARRHLDYACSQTNRPLKIR